MNESQTPPGGHPAQGDPQGVERPQLSSARRRIGGRLIDWFVWFVWVFIARLLIGDSGRYGFSENLIEPGTVEIEDLSTFRVTASRLLAIVVVVVYETNGNAKRGGTLGKRVTGSQVVKTDGSPLDLATSFRRMWLYLALAGANLVLELVGIERWFLDVLFLVGLIGMAMLFRDGLKQTPWDKIGGTMVVKK